MQQQLVYLHTEKNLYETEEILKQQGMEIILKTNSMSIYFSDMTDEEQISFLKTLEEDLEVTVEMLDIQDRHIEILARHGNSFSKDYREILKSLKFSKNEDAIKQFQVIKKKLRKSQRLAESFSDLRNRVRFLGLTDSVSCSCLIAKNGTDIIRYLSFEQDPVLTITGPNATNLKSSLEKQF